MPKKLTLLVTTALIAIAIGWAAALKPVEMPPKPLIAQVDSAMMIIDLEVMGSPTGELQYILHYAINGTGQVIWFSQKEEVLIYLKYLDTLGQVDYGWNKLLAQGIIE